MFHRLASSRLVRWARGVGSSSSSPAAPPAFFYNDTYVFELPPGHRFPMAKYRVARQMIQRALAATRASLAGDAGGDIFVWADASVSMNSRGENENAENSDARDEL